eukprot:jgi/Botrbrau1/12104/Bobra.0186s0025.1
MLTLWRPDGADNSISSQPGEASVAQAHNGTPSQMFIMHNTAPPHYHPGVYHQNAPYQPPEYGGVQVRPSMMQYPQWPWPVQQQAGYQWNLYYHHQVMPQPALEWGRLPQGYLPALPAPPPPEVKIQEKQPCSTIFIGGLKKSISKEKLVAALTVFGKVSDCQIMLDRTTKNGDAGSRSRGFAFATFENEDQAWEAISILQASPNRPELADEGVRVGYSYKATHGWD